MKKLATVLVFLGCVVAMPASGAEEDRYKVVASTLVVIDGKTGALWHAGQDATGKLVMVRVPYQDRGGTRSLTPPSADKRN